MLFVPQVTYLDKPAQFTAEQLMAMLLVDLKVGRCLLLVLLLLLLLLLLVAGMQPRWREGMGACVPARRVIMCHAALPAPAHHPLPALPSDPLQSIAETDSGAPVTDAVLAVPTYFTEPERHAMLGATQVRGAVTSNARGCKRILLRCL